MALNSSRRNSGGDLKELADYEGGQEELRNLSPWELSKVG